MAIFGHCVHASATSRVSTRCIASFVLRDDFGSMSIFGYLIVHLLIVQLVSTVGIPSQ